MWAPRFFLLCVSVTFFKYGSCCVVDNFKAILPKLFRSSLAVQYEFCLFTDAAKNVTIFTNFLKLQLLQLQNVLLSITIKIFQYNTRTHFHEKPRKVVNL